MWHHFAGNPNVGMSYRPYYLAKWLNTGNCDVKIFAATPHHLMKVKPSFTEPITREKIDSIDYFWIKSSEYGKTGLKRLINHFKYAWKLYKTNFITQYNLEKPDVIVVSSPHPFHYLAGLKWAKKYNCKLVFEVRDIWPLSLTELLGTSKFHPLVLYLNWLEKYAYTHSHAVVSLLPNAFLHMKTKGLKEEKFNYIPNGIDVTDVEKSIRDSDNYVVHSLMAMKTQGKVLIGYFGAHGIPNKLYNLIDAAEMAQAKGHTNLKFILVGSGVEKQNLLKYMEKKKCKNVHFFDPVAKAEVPEIVSLVNACYMGIEKRKLYDYGISPNKLFDYMLAAKPVIITQNGHKNPIYESGGGICIKPEDPAGLLSAILSICNLSEKEAKAMGDKGYNYLLVHHTYEVLANRYDALFRQIIDNDKNKSSISSLN